MTVDHFKTISKVKKMWKTISQVYDSKGHLKTISKVRKMWKTISQVYDSRSPQNNI